MTVLVAPQPDRVAGELAAVWDNRLDGEYLTDSLPRGVQSILAQRLQLLTVAFAPQQDFNLLPPIVAMLAGYFPRQRRGEAHDFVYCLRRELAAPVWAALNAIDRIRVGESAYLEFCPAPGQLRAIAWGIASPFWSERARIVRILRAKPPRAAESVERRRAVAARILGELRTRAGFPVALQGVGRISSKVGSGPSRGVDAVADKCLSLPDF